MFYVYDCVACVWRKTKFKFLTYQWGFVVMINDSNLSIFSDNIYFFKLMAKLILELWENLIWIFETIILNGAMNADNYDHYNIFLITL